MSFQWIIDGAESLTINTLDIVASTETRSGVIRATTRGSQPARITVQLPTGLIYTSIRTNLLAAQALDRYQTAVIEIKYSLFPWYYGNVTPPSNESYTVLCTQFPDVTFIAPDRVGWSGPFVFQEYVS
jgi:hypothetical protein